MFNHKKFFLNFICTIFFILCPSINLLSAAAALESGKEAYRHALLAKKPGPHLADIAATYPLDTFDDLQQLAIGNALINAGKASEAAKWVKSALKGDHSKYETYDYYNYIAETLGFSLEKVLEEESDDKMRIIIAEQIKDKSTSLALEAPVAGGAGAAVSGEKRREGDENLLTDIQVGEFIAKYFKKVTKKPIKPVLLQKTAVYANAAFCAQYKKSLISDSLCHFENGPIYYDLWRRFIKAPGRNIEVDDDSVDESLFSKKQRNIILKAIDAIKDYTEDEISKLSHEQDPLWFGVPKDCVIPYDVALGFYSTKGKEIEIIRNIIGRTDPAE